jgi:hypothetical protein
MEENINTNLINFRSRIEYLKKFNLPVGEFVVVSSGALAVRGIRVARDIDVVVTDSLWSELIKQYKVEQNKLGIERIDLGSDVEVLNPSQSIFGNSGEEWAWRKSLKKLMNLMV